MDNDAKGAEFEEKVRAAILKGSPEARIEKRPPPSEFKDWNGLARGVTAIQEKAAKEELRRKIEAEAQRTEEILKERLRQEEERRRLAAETQAATPSVPRMR